MCRTFANVAVLLACAGFAGAPAAESAFNMAKTFQIENDGFVGVLLEPTEPSAHVGVVVVGGSEGGIPRQKAQLFAERGYVTLALAYFREPGLPGHLDEVSLEPALTAIAWMDERLPGPDSRVVLVGGSKGAELALLLGSLEPRAGAVVTYAPTHVVFQGIPEVFWPARSSWVHEGEPLPFVPYKYGPHFNPFADEPDLLALYRESLTQEPLVERATIAVERINGPVLLFSGEQDQMWPATQMAEQIVQRLQEHDHPHPVEHHAYPDAGHVIHPEAGDWSLPLGGTVQGNRQAGSDALRRVTELLATLDNAAANSGANDEQGD